MPHLRPLAQGHSDGFSHEPVKDERLLLTWSTADEARQRWALRTPWTPLWRIHSGSVRHPWRLGLIECSLDNVCNAVISSLVTC